MWPKATYLRCFPRSEGMEWNIPELLAGGEGGIRTLDTLLTYTPLAGERLQPLGHFSGNVKSGTYVLACALSQIGYKSGYKLPPKPMNAVCRGGARLSHPLAICDIT